MGWAYVGLALGTVGSMVTLSMAFDYWSDEKKTVPSLYVVTVLLVALAVICLGWIVDQFLLDRLAS